MTVYPNIDNISIHRLVPYYLMSSYLYYHHDKHVLTDADYDKLCKRLLDNYDDIKHVHKRKINRKALAAGTGYQINLKTFTNMIRGAAESWYQDYQKELKEYKNA
jgi:NAD-dependent DNA ligase